MPNKFPQVSVVIPAYNSEKTVLKALDSVLKQSFQDFEIIVVNDGSIDSTLKVVEDFKKNNCGSLSIITTKNHGVSAARNAGIRASNGEYIALLDSDDYWHPQKLHSQLAILRNKSIRIDFLTCLRNNEVIGFPYRFHNGLAKVTLRKLLLKVVGQTSTAIFRKEIIHEVGLFDESQRYSEDANFWMRVSINHNFFIEDKSYVTTGDGKSSFGESGLSSNLLQMEMGARKNILEIYHRREITTLEFYAFYSFAVFKYYFRKLKVSLR
jgi:glycosyltransferase involved in cell wall biosynthesis